MNTTENIKRITDSIRSPVEAFILLLVNNIIISHGRPRPINMSKIFDPIALLTAIPPLPCLATITEDIISGIDVPIAKTVKAIITSGT